jgi:signal transduction histidine kinase
LSWLHGTAKGILGEVLHARPSEVEVMIQRRLEAKSGRRGANMLYMNVSGKSISFGLSSTLKLIDMKNWNVLIIVITLLTATGFFMHLALAKEESMGMANESHITSSNKTELVSFVESALAYAQENGKDKALDEFSNKTGSFVRGDLYIYAYDFNGTCLAHPFKPDWIGKNKLDVTDSNGVPSLRNTLNVAKEGKGFTYFIFPNPAHGNRDEFKIAYAMKVDDNWFLGSGIYISCS